MSLDAFVWAVKVRGLKPAPKIVLINLANRHNKDTGRCDPRLSLLADDCEMSRASLLRHLADLERLGLITRVARGRDNGGRTSSQYDLHIDQTSQIETGGKGLKSEGQRSQIGGGKGLTVETPYIEPVLNQEEPGAHECADDLFSENRPSEEDHDPVEAEIEEGFKEFWDEIWPSHSRKTGKADCRKVYASAIRGKHPKYPKISAADLNAATRAYIASVSDKQFLKGTLPWLRLPGWEPFVGQPEAPKRLTRAQIMRNSARGLNHVGP